MEVKRWFLLEEFSFWRQILDLLRPCLDMNNRKGFMACERIRKDPPVKYSITD